MHISGPAKFGFLLGIGAFTMVRFIGPAALFLTIGILLAFVSTVVWRRTRLPLMTVGMTLGTLVSLAMAGMAFKGAPGSVRLTLGCIFAGVFILCIEIEKRWHPERMNEWKRAASSATLTDMIRLKHIPKLTGGVTQKRSRQQRQ